MGVMAWIFKISCDSNDLYDFPVNWITIEDQISGFCEKSI